MNRVHRLDVQVNNVLSEQGGLEDAQDNNLGSIDCLRCLVLFIGLRRQCASS
ncbi:MAG: hypothetical protein U0905_20350 [Pirellulales bacterium]